MTREFYKRFFGLVGAPLVMWMASCTGPSSDPQPPFASAAGPVVIAHRGGALEAPENTLAAIKHAVEVESDWQEIDVQLSADHHVIVIHDDTVDRTTTGSGPVAEKLAEELHQLSAGQPEFASKVKARLESLGVAEPAFGDRFVQEKVPSLEQVLRLQDSRLMIEVKADPRAELVVRKVMEVINRSRAGGRVAIASFDQAILKQCLKRDPSIPLIGIARTEDDIEEMFTLPIRALAVRGSLVTFAVESAPSGVAIWAYTAYTSQQAEEFTQQGAHGIVTDVPSQVVQLLRSQAE